ncbi:hypothetical protein NIES2109_61870 (plasmid) [Nostoc sp. HK-01]|nr:hypothetical protein NIES2109_61870 [Nostoc sp. HK-01]
MADKRQLVYPVVDVQQQTARRTAQRPIKVVKTSCLTKLNYQYPHFQTQPDFNNRIFGIIASLSILSTSLFGISVLGCWGLELVDSNVIARINDQSHWRTKKHICLGWMLASFCSFVGSATFANKITQR